LCQNFVLMYMHLRVENGDRKVATKFCSLVCWSSISQVKNKIKLWREVEQFNGSVNQQEGSMQKNVKKCHVGHPTKTLS
jgi:hypothetical protein